MQCTFPGCEQPATFHVSRVYNRTCIDEDHLCESHARENAEKWHEPYSPFDGKRAVLQLARQIEIITVIVSEINDQQVVYLHEVDGDRAFPLLIGIFEATSIDRRLKDYYSPRPLTHDVWVNSIRLLGAEVEYVLIERLESHTYYASAKLKQDGRSLSLDLRPSDAFALALLTDCPMFIADVVLEQIAPRDKSK